MRRKDDPIIPFWDEPLVPFTIEHDQGMGVPRQCHCGGMIRRGTKFYECSRCGSSYGSATEGE